MRKLDPKIKRHALLIIHCPNIDNKKADYREERGRFICNYCEADFTEELKDIYHATVIKFAN